MPLTQSQISDIKNLIVGTIRDVFTADFISEVADKVKEKIHFDEMKTQLDCQAYKIRELKEANSILLAKIDYCERSSKFNNMRIYGLREEKDGSLCSAIANFIRGKLNPEFSENDIDFCTRLGKPSDGKPRAILLRVVNHRIKRQIMDNRRKLKGSKVFFVDDITGQRYQLLKTIKADIGGKDVWVSEGRVYCRIGGEKYCCDTIDQYERVKKNRT